MSYLASSQSSRTKPLIKQLCLQMMLFLLTVISASSSFAVIRDTEIENALRVYVQPLLKAAHLEDEHLTITIIQDPSINAVILPGGKILIHTGLLIQAKKPTEVSGVLAHELGHYLNNDILKLTDGFERNFQSSILGVALGLGLSLATGNAEPLVAGSLLGSHVGQRNFLQFSRSMESGADRRAVDLLHRSGLGLSGMVALNKHLLETTPNPNFADAQYLSSHPLTENRVEYFGQYLERFGARPMPEGWQQVHDRVRAKLIGFIHSPDAVFDRYPDTDVSLPAKMARSIALMRLSKYDEATALMASLLQDYPEDGFLFDLMGDIQRQSGYPEKAIGYYSTAIDLLPWAPLLRLQRAKLLLKKANRSNAESAINDLEQALRFEPDVPAYWYSLARAHELMDAEGHRQLAMAEATILQHQYSVARSFAKRAQLEFMIDSASWLRADDIITDAEIRLKNAQGISK